MRIKRIVEVHKTFGSGGEDILICPNCHQACPIPLWPAGDFSCPKCRSYFTADWVEKWVVEVYD